MNDQIIDNDTGEVHDLAIQEISGAVAAEISQQVATAKRYPRRPDKTISSEIMSRATLDEETAAECIYSLPRAGKDITGPSIRFAEIVFASFGNMRAGARFVEIDTKDPMRAAVIIEGVCIDMQMNNGQTVPVRRSIVGKKGVFNADMTNIAFSAGAAIARREAILKTVPKSIWGAAWKQVVAVLQGDVKTLAARRRSALEAFQKMGVDPAKVIAELGVADEESVTLEHMPRLIGMWTALRDGTETIESLFGKGGHAHETVDNPLKDQPKETAKPDPISSGISETIARNADKATQGAQAMAQERTETASTDGAKTDMAAEASGKPADGGSATGAAKPGPAKNNAQATPVAGVALYSDAAGYMMFMRDEFDKATSEAAVNDLWGSTRRDRQELLDQPQLIELEADKKAKIAGLRLKKGGA